MPWWNMHYFYAPQKGGIFSFFPLLVPAMIWSLIWKGLALYRAGRNEQKGWFIALLLINSLGILEIVYLLFFSQVLHERSYPRKKR